MRIAAAILAGGKASRLGGIVKGLMPGEHGISIVGRLIAELAAAGITDLVISANEPQPYSVFGRSIIADMHPEIGPLGGIEAVLHHFGSRYDCVVLLPSDLPNITVQEILKLVRVQQSQPDRIVFAGTTDADGTQSSRQTPSAVRPAAQAAGLFRSQELRADGTGTVPAMLREHPLCAVVPVLVLPEVSAAIASGSYGVGRLWKSLGSLVIEIDDATRLMNINTPEDLRHWRGPLG